MGNTTISISIKTREQLEVIKEKFQLKNWEDTVSKISFFVLDNRIDINTDFGGENLNTAINLEKRILSQLDDLEKKLTKDNRSLRNWVGGIENDYFKPLVKKLDLLEYINKSEINKIDNDSLKNIQKEKPAEMSISSSISDESSTLVKQLLQEREVSKLAKQELNVLLSQYKSALSTIIDSTKIESVGMLGKEKLVINLAKNEFEKIKQGL